MSQIKGGDPLGILIEKSEATDVRKNVLANFEKLKDELLKMAEEAAGVLKDSKKMCWWDAKPCWICSEIIGLQEAGTSCNGCHRVDLERFVFILERIVPDFLDLFRQRIEEEVRTEITGEMADERREAGNIAWEEINKKVTELVEIFNDK